jgi:hypothetical protein
VPDMTPLLDVHPVLCAEFPPFSVSQAMLSEVGAPLTPPSHVPGYYSRTEDIITDTTCNMYQTFNL